MISFIGILKKIYHIFFETFLKVNEESSCEFFLNFIWLTFAYLKKNILKRKNDKLECATLLCCILDEFRKEFIMNKIIKEGSNSLGDFDYYFIEFNNYFNLSANASNNLDKKINLLKSGMSPIINKLIKELKFSFEKLKIKYNEILIPDEIDDIKIFENYFIDIKLKTTPIRNNVKKLYSNLSNTTGSSTNSNKINMFKNSMSLSSSPLELNYSPNNFKILSNNFEKQSLEQFFEELKDFGFLDISFLFKKFSKFSLDNNIFNYNNFFEIFQNKFISVYLNKSEKLETQFTNHKSLYLKLVEELLDQERCKFKLHEGFNALLNDESFHFNFLIIAFYIYLNLLLIEKASFLEKILYNFLNNLNKFKHFDFINIFRIITNLTKINLPLNIKNILKQFQNNLITYVLWQEDSVLYLLLSKENSNKTDEHSDEEMNRSIRNIIRKVYIYIGSCIYKLSKVLNLDTSLREKIWVSMKEIIGVEYSIIKNNFIDTLILRVFDEVIKCNCNVNKDRNGDKINLNFIVNKYREIKKSANFDLLDKVYPSTIKSLQEKDLSFIHKLSINIETSHVTHDYMSIDLDFSALLPYLQEDYNVIFSNFPTPTKPSNIYISNSESEYLGNKRIRALTPPLSSKVLSFSPYSVKSSFTYLKNNSAFKNLNNVFSTIKKDSN